MEKLTIKPWQVMQAHENGAVIEMALIGSNKWSNIVDILWNWYTRNYRIANLTADGMRLDELVEKFPEVIKLCAFGCFFNENYSTKEVLSLVLNKPELISQIKLRQEKKLRPWTMFEFEEHFGEPFRRKNCSKDGDIYRCLGYNKTGVLFPLGINILFEDLFNDYTRFDGSPCGVIE